MDSDIGKLTRVPLREVWKHEAYDFTQWLQKNIDVLDEALNLSLSNVDREQATPLRASRRYSHHQGLNDSSAAAAARSNASSSIGFAPRSPDTTLRAQST
jgi:hypothetical protein